MFEAPVDNNIGFLVFEIASSNGIFVISEDEILKAGTNLIKKLTESMSKGVDKKSIFNFKHSFDNFI